MTDTIYPYGGGGSAETTFIGKWKPIETAPKDDNSGVRFLACSKDGWVEVVKVGWVDDEGVAYVNDDYMCVGRLTHWMPLPQPPEVTE